MKPSGKERRITGILQRQWDSLRGERIYPKIEEIDAKDLPDVWQDCWLVKITDERHKRTHHYSYIGANIKNIYDGKMEHAAVLGLTDKLYHRYMEIAHIKKPLIDESQFVTLKGDVVKYRQILLPFGPNELEVSHILGGMRYRVYE